MAQKKKTSSSSPSLKKNKAGFTSSDFETPEIPDYVIVELRYESPVAYAASKFTAPGAAEPQAASLNKTLEKYDIAAVRSHFGLKSGVVKSRVEIAATLPPEPAPEKFADKGMDLNFIRSGFVQIVPKNSTDAKKIAKEFNAKNSVWKAFVAPRPVPAGATGHAAGSRNFEPSQGYLYSAPDGVGAPEIWHLDGAKGKGVTICDVEGNWNRKHEDLPSGIKHLGGELLNYVEWRNHGTAVLGEMISQPNTIGTVGISHEANGAVQSVIYDGVFNIARAIANATEHLSAGDVLLRRRSGWQRR